MAEYGQGELPIDENIFGERVEATISGLEIHTPDTHFAALQALTVEGLSGDPIATSTALRKFASRQVLDSNLPAPMRHFYEDFEAKLGQEIDGDPNTENGVKSGVKAALNLTGGEVKG